jgi:hypothetical protein
MHIPLVSLRATMALARGDTVPAKQAVAFTREALARGVRPPVDPWLPLRLEAELRLTRAASPGRPWSSSGPGRPQDSALPALFPPVTPYLYLRF